MKALKLSFFLGLVLVSCLSAESRVWKSTSGSTIEARFLGAFGEDYWFEASEDGRFIKMPAKYISAEEVKLVESGEIKGTLPADICDDESASIELLELIYTRESEALADEVEKLKEAIEQLIAPFQPTDEEAAPIEISFTKRKYRKLPVTDKPEKGTVMQALEQLLKPHELSFQIREGGLIIGKD